MEALDSILINGLEFYAYHGASDQEQTVGHRYLLDATLGINTRRAGESDQLTDTVSYSQVARRMVQVGTEMQFRLLEALGARMVETIFADFPKVQTIRLRLQKVCPPMNAIVAAVGIEIFRART